MSENQPYNEKELLLRIAEGDEQAFARIVEYYSARIYSHVLAYLKKPAIAEETTQDVFLSVWRHRASLPQIENFAGWLYVVARNRTHSVFRSQLEHDQLPVKDQVEDQLHTPLAAMEYKELSDTLHRGIEQLPPRRQQVFRMSRLEGKTYDEIAAALGISRSAVNQHIVEAISFLRTWLHQEMGLLIASFFIFQ